MPGIDLESKSGPIKDVTYLKGFISCSIFFRNFSLFSIFNSIYVFGFLFFLSTKQLFAQANLNNSQDDPVVNGDPGFFGTIVDFIAAIDILPTFSSEMLSQMDRSTLALLALIVGLVCVILFMSIMILWGRAKRQRRIHLLSHELGKMRSLLDRAESFIAAQQGLHIVWEGQNCDVLGNLNIADSMPQNKQELLEFERWLTPESAHLLKPSIASLRQGGELFSLIIDTRNGDCLRAEGITVGGRAVVSFQLTSDYENERAELEDTCDQLKKVNDTLVDFMEAVDIPIWARNQDGRLNWVNSAYAVEVGVDSAAQALDTPGLLDQQTLTSIDSALMQSSVTEQKVSLETPHGKRELDLLAVATQTGTMGMIRPVASSLNLTKDLQSTAEVYELTLDGVSTAVAVFGNNKRLQTFNRAFAELWNLDANWLKKSPTDHAVFDSLREAGMLQEHANYKEWKEGLLESCSVDKSEGLAENWHLPDGRTIAVVKKCHSAVGSIFLFENLTDNLQMESRFRASLNIQRETLDNLNEAVVQFSSGGVLQLYNPAFARLFGLNEEELKSKPHINTVLSWAKGQTKDEDALNTIQRRVTALDHSRSAENQQMNLNNGKILDLTIIPLPGGGTLVTFTDISDAALSKQRLEERNQALEKADKIKNDFVQHVSYVLRAPLTTVIGYAELLSQSTASLLDKDHREYTNNILTASHSLHAIVSDILDLTTIDADAMELKLDTVDARLAMRAARQGLKDRIDQGNFEVNISTERYAMGFKADESRVKQVLFNILSNAVANATPGSAIDFDCYERDGFIEFSVRNIGKGISPKQIEAVFERFQSTPPTTGQRGAGLGLPLVKSLVELHGGNVSISSTPNEYTIVTCRFPKKQGEFVPSEEQETVKKQTTKKAISLKPVPTKLQTVPKNENSENAIQAGQ